MIKTVILDLGNVLVHFDHELILRRLAARFQGASSHEIRLRDLEPIMESFETASIGEEEFINELSERFGLSEYADAGEVREWWNDIFWANRELLEILPSLKDRVRLVLLSNTNMLHAGFLREKFPEVFAPFEDVILSHETGRRKPDPDVFRTVLERSSAKPDECLYFDDIDLHVEAARALGFHAYPYISLAGARDILRVYELL